MKLASHSPVLLSALIEVSSKSFTPDLFREMNRFSDQWVKFAGGRQALLDLVVHLILYTEDSAEYIMNLLLDTTRHPDKVVAATAEEILELLIKELDVSVRVNSAKIPLLDCILKNLDGMLSSLISDEELRVSTSVTIFSLIGQHHPNILADCVSYILLRSTNDDHLASVVKLTQGYKASDILSPAIVLSLGGDRCKDPIPPNLFWINLSKLLKWEASGTLTSLPMQEAVWANLVAITELLYSNEDVEVAHSMAEVTKRAVLGSKSQPSIHLIMTLVQATVTYFYICLTHSVGLEQLKGLRVVNSLLSKLSQSSQAGRAMAFRELLESALFKAPSVLFGAVPEPTKRLIQPASNLLMDNHKHGISILLTQRHSSVFHAGVIGNGKRKMAPSCPTPADTVVENTHLLIMALKACCSNENPQGALDAVISMALLLVELISPDVMYNGLPWPEEEFCKVTVERDLYIRRVFDNVPLLWSLLAYIAYHRPALCYCSVLLRALIATLLGQWTSVGQQGQKAGQCKSLASTTMKVLQLMSLSQLLPPPLSALGNVIEHLPPNQVVLVLRDCVWNYMRDHVPSPALFSRDSNGAMWRDPSTSRPPKQYTETLRLVMLKNISSLGPLYNTLFVQEDIMDED
ncbi:hypothetical protein AAG570_001783 [Ranatra chinensis]|uniref:Integrator complex subunit 5 C-terminal domain-containing protein n=1 Tax=Ranatra chinensis TaxID=642074 RepID=A0ABD0YW23_9HEMI